MHHQLYQADIRKIPELVELSKTFRYPSKIAAFKDNCLSREEVDRFLQENLLDNDKYWLTRKAFVILTHFGNLR